MSEISQEFVERAQQNTEVEAPESVSVEEFRALQAKFEQLAGSKERILEESKGYKQKYQELRGTLEQKERSKLEEKEQWKELLEKERQDRMELEQRAKTLQKKAVLNTVNYEVARLAGDALDVQDVINNLKLNEDNVDFETGKVEGLSSQIDEIKQKKPWLFKTDVPRTNTSMPQYKGEAPKDWKEKSPVEQNNELTDLLTQHFG